MKVLILSVLIIAAVHADKADELFEHLDLNTDTEQKLALDTTTKCLKETNVDPELIKKTEEGVFPDDKNLKCYYNCLGINFGTINKNGEFNIEKILAVTSGLVEEIAMKCTASVKSTDPCERAYDAYKCFRGDILKNAKKN